MFVTNVTVMLLHIIVILLHKMDAYVTRCCKNR